MASTLRMMHDYWTGTYWMMMTPEFNIEFGLTLLNSNAVLQQGNNLNVLTQTLNAVNQMSRAGAIPPPGGYGWGLQSYYSMLGTVPGRMISAGLLVTGFLLGLLHAVNALASGVLGGIGAFFLACSMVPEGYNMQWRPMLFALIFGIAMGALIVFLATTVLPA